ncbi:5-oxoprolinase subunit PxpB [Pseudoalteromonas tunicata]|jgi:KipI family sensor histidine kinase inhibitor|uniref:Carboxyltransferase domain-containing protein n=1 Tax=Pseudoalteromonas tunicata D2 TaxID=87626 RepID=A4CAP5_9GAMM|nr:5-oxoprolinase subunit PxpB [Pseudoalteromonas tunicata]ATC94998.1 hypothetical protein PTUN_a2534 [Pseudoalteromonas tunicata]AXT30654.1 5-oxoprolinase subunit PxpB [Pseudoalteromonas tunicata]EAR28453.1 hypothetical protein PTD2_21597 [Pseudoalteromonas tunicata D2]
MSYRIEVASENALIVYLAMQPSNECSTQIHTLVSQLRQQLGDTLIDLIPSYTSLLIIYDPFLVDHFAVKKLLLQLLDHPQSLQQQSSKLIRLPVWYDAPATPDLALIAAHHQLSKVDVINLHQATHYHVFAIGFAPGFAFLGEIPPQIAMPRHATPRASVPKGAVAIADRQTAVYPSRSPGGWNLIGLCPFDLFNPKHSPVMAFEVGDSVEFYEIDEAEYHRLGGKE